MLTRDQILSADDRRLEEVQVPEWGGSIFVRVMSGRDRDKFEFDCQKGKEEVGHVPDFRAKFVASIACDENGELLFSESDIEQLGSKSASALDRILNRGLELAGMDPDAVEQAGEG